MPTGGSRALDADIQNREGVALEVVAVACAGECFEVVAVARGGYPPYTFEWEDGSTSAVRRLCPEANQTFEVTVTDRGYKSEEFIRASETVTATVTADVLACPDAGMPDSGRPQPADAGVPDAGSEPSPYWNPRCIRNGSFEEWTSGMPWRNCPPAVPVVVPTLGHENGGLGMPEAPDGTQYLQMDPEPGQPVTMSVPLCEPIVTGKGYYWTESWTLAFGSGPVLLEFFYSKSECGLDGKLSDAVPDAAWSNVCSTWPALWDAEWLTVRAVATGARSGRVYLDAFFDSSAQCPAPAPEPGP